MSRRLRINDSAFRYYARLQSVKQYFDRHYTEPISLKTAAAVAGIESKYFSAFFRAKTGVRFRDWISYERITLATERMKSRNETITNTAFAVGFQDLRTFQRAFKKFTAMTPQAYKQKIRPC